MKTTFKFGILFLVCLTASCLSLPPAEGTSLEHEAASEKTPLFGNGSPFQWVSSLQHADIREVSGRSGWHINQIKVRTTDREEEETSPSFGGDGGNLFTWTVPDGEYIAKVEFIEGNWFGVIFVTDKGTRSPQFGGHEGSTSSTYVVPDGKRLAGIFGRKDHTINGLGFYLAPVRRRINRKLPAYGNYNSYAWKFEWVAEDNNASLARIEGASSWYINRIKFQMDSGEASPTFGGYGGTAFNHVIPAGQHIVSATFNTSRWLDSVTFKTNEGQQIYIGGDRGSYVDPQKHLYTENIPEGANIVGLYGKYYGSRIRTLGLIIAE